MSKKTRKHIRPTETPVLFAVGDVIKHPKYGTGVITKVSFNHIDNYDFFYHADFTGKGGDGTKVWLPKAKSERTVLLLKRDGQPWDNAPACDGTRPDCPATCWGVDNCPLCRKANK
jgi:hypothetical protein